MYSITTESPITKKSIKQVGILYVDDTNLWLGLLDEEEDFESATSKAQERVNRWVESLEVVGGALNPEKCAWTVHDMLPGENGEWEYRDVDKKGKKGDTRSGRQEELDELDNLEMMAHNYLGTL